MASPAALVGSLVFHGDQQRSSYRFFGERGVSCARLWCSRQAIGLAVVAAWILVVMASGDWVKVVQIHSSDRSEGAFVFAALAAALYGLLAYSAGQLCSQLIRSGVLAIVFGLLSALLIYAWTWWMHTARVPFPWSVCPLPVLLLWVTYRRMNDWLLDRRTRGARLRTTGWLLGPAIALGIAVPAFRAYQVPEIHPSPARPDFVPTVSSEAAATAAMYRRARNASKPRRFARGRGLTRKEWVRAVLDENEEALRIALAAAAREECDFSALADPAFRADTNPHGSLWFLGRLINLSASIPLERGNLDLSLDYYVAALRLALHARTAYPQRFTGVG